MTPGATRAIAEIAGRARAARAEAERRWRASAPDAGPQAEWDRALRSAGRLTLNFHPDRISRSGRTAAAGLLIDGAYRTQWVTGISAGSRSAIGGGQRDQFEHTFFASAYGEAKPPFHDRPVYGAFDLLVDDHGGAPRFGSSYLVLADHVRDRTTLCVGDSHLAPADVGTFDDLSSILAGLIEQAVGGRLLDRPLGVEDLLGAMSGTRAAGPAARTLDGYLEAQVHGGVSLVDDVDQIVLDPSFRGTAIERDATLAAERHGVGLGWHEGSELRVADVPDDFRGPTMISLAKQVARPDGVIDAHAIGVAAANEQYEEPTTHGDNNQALPQQLKYLWHTLVAFGSASVS